MIGEQLRAQKNRVEADLRKVLFGRRIFSPLRNAYQFFLNRDKLSNRRQMRKLYSSYIQRGDLVFDVGANAGIYTEIFLELGARVVAVEPNPHCCRVINASRKSKCQNRKLCRGKRNRQILLQLSDNTQLSTVNQEWLKSVKRSPLHAGANWLGEIEVELTTLDRLAEKYGTPSFIKIDVEGFDDQVLRGMSFMPCALTFEFNRLLPDIAMRCVRMPTSLQTMNSITSASLTSMLPQNGLAPKLSLPTLTHLQAKSRVGTSSLAKLPADRQRSGRKSISPHLSYANSASVQPARLC